jgi:membrane-bound serine protease (ClpP class)
MGELNEKDQPVAPASAIGPQPVRILNKGKLLTLTANEAEAYGLIPTTVTSEDQLLGLYDQVGARKVYIEMTVPEKIFRWLTNPMVSGILFMIAIGGMYIEIRTPGFGLPGIISLIAFTLFFGARAVLGIADWIDLVLVLVGAALLLVEFFVLPGFGIAGVAGVACLIAGLVLSFMLSDFELPKYEWQYDRLEDAGVAMVTAAVSLSLFFLAAWKFLPRTPAYRRLILTSAQEDALGYVVQTEEDEEGAIGLKGVALTMLRPAGRARFGDRTIQVVSRAQYIEKGQPVVVVQVEGNRYVVDPIEESS